MNWFLENCTPENISIALICGLVAIGCIAWFNHYLKWSDEQWKIDNPLPDDEQEAVDRANAVYYDLPQRRQEQEEQKKVRNLL